MGPRDSGARPALGGHRRGSASRCPAGGRSPPARGGVDRHRAGYTSLELMAQAELCIPSIATGALEEMRLLAEDVQGEGLG